MGGRIVQRAKYVGSVRKSRRRHCANALKLTKNELSLSKQTPKQHMSSQQSQAKKQIQKPHD